MTRIRMTHPNVDGDYLADPLQVPHLEEAGWQVADGADDSQVERWPADLRRFEGQAQIRLHNPAIEGDPVITVGDQSVPYHREKGWLLVDEAAVTDAAQTADDLDSLTVDQLKDEARARDLPVSGTKAELLERLRAEPTPDQDQAGDAPAQDSEEE